MFKDIISEFNEVCCQCIVKMLSHFEEINLLQAMPMEFVVNDNFLLISHYNEWTSLRSKHCDKIFIFHTQAKILFTLPKTVSSYSKK